MASAPSYDGRGLVNLVAELEMRLTGSAAWSGLTDPDPVPDAGTYVLMVFDGLGIAQLEHPSAGAFREANRATIESPFPTTTSVAKATIATGLPPSRHGLSAHLAWMEDLGQVVNTLKWVNLHGDHVGYDHARLLPQPNLWERLRGAGMEPIVIEPGPYQDSPLSRVLFRGARFEGYWDHQEVVEATTQLAAVPGRLIVTYLPEVDFSAHVFGLDSAEFGAAMEQAARVWDRIRSSIPPGAALLGTADHGLAGFDEQHKILIRDPRWEALRFAGDSRGVQMWGDPGLMDDLARHVGGELADPSTLIGPEPTPAALGRIGERVLLPPDDIAVIPKGFDKRLLCYHGGLSRAEVEIPLLVGA